MAQRKRTAKRTDTQPLGVWELRKHQRMQEIADLGGAQEYTGEAIGGEEAARPGPPRHERPALEGDVCPHCGAPPGAMPVPEDDETLDAMKPEWEMLGLRWDDEA